MSGNLIIRSSGALGVKSGSGNLALFGPAGNHCGCCGESGECTGGIYANSYEILNPTLFEPGEQYEFPIEPDFDNWSRSVVEIDGMQGSINFQGNQADGPELRDWGIEGYVIQKIAGSRVKVLDETGGVVGQSATLGLPVGESCPASGVHRTIIERIRSGNDTTVNVYAHTTELIYSGAGQAIGSACQEYVMTGKRNGGYLIGVAGICPMRMEFFY